MAALVDAAAADVIVKASGVGVFDELLEAEVADACVGPVDTVIFWDVDAPATLERVDGDLRDPFRALIPQLRPRASPMAAGEPVVEAYRRLGARDCVPIYNALDPGDPPPGAAGRGASPPIWPSRQPAAGPRGAGQGILPRAPPGAARQDLHPGRQRLVGSSICRRTCARSATSARGEHNASQRLRARGPQRQSREHGALRLLAADAGVRGGRRRRLPDHRSLARDRAVLGAGLGNPRRRRRGGGGRALRALTPERARGIGEAARRAILRDHTYAARAVQVEAVLAERRTPGRTPRNERAFDRLPRAVASPRPGATATPRPIAALVKGLARRGHQVLFLERDVPWYAAHRDLPQSALRRRRGSTGVWTSCGPASHGAVAAGRSGGARLLRARGRRGRRAGCCRHRRRRDGLLRHRHAGDAGASCAAATATTCRRT